MKDHYKRPIMQGDYWNEISLPLNEVQTKQKNDNFMYFLI